jgi:Fe2+ transport system protein FeoA
MVKTDCEENLYMYIPLVNAPPGKPLELIKVLDPDLVLRLKRMGLFEGSELMRLEQDVLVQPVRVSGPKRDVVLGGGMAMKIVMHMGDGRKLPLSEMGIGETGHIEGITGGPDLAGTLETLELKTNDPIRFLRKLPPMEYTAIIRSGVRVRITEGTAAKIWGCMQNRLLQFVSAKTGENFRVEKILGGANARQLLKAKGIEPGINLVLESVAQAQTVFPEVRNPVVVTSREGLRLFLKPADARKIMVRQIDSGL